jgi:hypothetical protein
VTPLDPTRVCGAVQAAIAHRFSFTYKDYVKPDTVSAEDRMPFIHAFLESSVPKEVLRDIRRAAVGALAFQSSNSLELHRMPAE